VILSRSRKMAGRARLHFGSVQCRLCDMWSHKKYGIGYLQRAASTNRESTLAGDSTLGSTKLLSKNMISLPL
jgi:hypothetical protein